MSTLPALRPICRPMTRSIFDAGKKSAERIISDLFSAGQQGFWLPFTDFASLTQDSAGTLPYTALEQPVGLILDKSKGGGRGPELSPNGGTFDDAAGWTITQPTSSISGGVLNVGAGACDIFPLTASVVAGKSYEVTFTISNSTANYGIRILNRDIIGSGNYFPAGGQYITANGSYRFVCVALSNGSIGVNRVGGHTGSLQIDNFSVKEIPGNHASQPTSTSRGVVSARVNLLQSTNSFSGGGWGGGTGVVVTPAAVLSPLGGMADKIEMTAVGSDWRQVVQVVSTVVGTSYSGKFLVKAAAPEDIGKVIAFRHAGASAYLLITLTADWAWVVRDEVSINSSTNFAIAHRPAQGTTSGVISFHLAAAELKLANQASLPYQRVNTPTDYDAVGFPKYLRLDGTDDFYTCGGGGSTTGFYYSDVVRPTTSTFSALLDDSTAGGGYLVQRTNTGIHFSAKAGGVATAVSLPLAANVQAFVLAMDDGVNLTLQVNSAQVSVARPVVTAGSSTMYLGRYTTVAQYFGGSMTEPIYRAGPPPNAYERDVIRTYQMQKAGML